jgi:hypothetical protein
MWISLMKTCSPTAVPNMVNQRSHADIISRAAPTLSALLDDHPDVDVERYTRLN